ncbi:uncharacterized protein BHQ10_007932 [Talaromyces amestolkiae]|uniref:Uncharacterized protein n=1 Tax=Talaromyces amestolkiae TaxID=1196081 RepID=A0A364L7W2_TALAM|nr:uncharacterized protein BHQ10_007932 [Talaromyces amestolkiae]RAO71920.1 hypothetical protein BHQ10_007932 [Talaromyces amestolkiae]
MGVDQDKVDKIRAFADRGRNLEKQYGDSPLSLDAIQHYNRRLDDTIQSLQDHVKRQEDALRKASHMASNYIKGFITNVDIATRQQLKDEQDDLEDAKRIHEGLRARIQRIKREQSENSTKSPSELADDFVNAERKKTRALKSSSSKLRKDLEQFIDEHLASQLAAEDLGGPVVGDIMEVPDSTLEAGYTAHGKPKKPKSSSAQNDDDDDPRQQRIDNLLRRQRGEDDDGSNAAPRNKREAAAVAMRELINSLLESGTSYVELPRESAASRFLVRVKVAQLHPRDARRIRLIDFGRSFED